MAPYCSRFFFGSSTGRCRCVPRTVAIPAGRRLDGFATWFECDFGDGSPKLSTAPAAQATHWKQTIFYLREPVEGEGHEVEGQGSVWWLGENTSYGSCRDVLGGLFCCRELMNEGGFVGWLIENLFGYRIIFCSCYVDFENPQLGFCHWWMYYRDTIHILHKKWMSLYY